MEGNKGRNRPYSANDTSRYEPKIGHEGTFHLKLKWGERIPPSSIEDDVGAVANGYVSISWLSRLISQGPPIESSVEGRFNSVFES